MIKQPRSIVVSSRSIHVSGDFGGGYSGAPGDRDGLLKAIVYCSPLGELGGSIVGAGNLLTGDEKTALRKQQWEV